MRLALPIILILSLIGVCIEVDISAPSFPDMARYFGTSEEMIQWTLSLNFLGFCLSSLLWGPLSESFGRRPMLIFGNTIFVLGGLGCALGPSIEAIIACRFIQGFGASATSIIAIAMIADTYQGERAAKFNGMLNSFITAAVAIAPIAGGFINYYLGWRANYSSVALISLITLLFQVALIPETKKVRDRWDPRKIVGQYATVLTNKKFLIYSFVPSILISGYLAFLGCGAFFYIDTLGTTLMEYSLHQGIIVASFSIVSFCSGRVTGWIGKHASVWAGTVLAAAASAGLVILSCAPASITPYAITSFMSLFCTGIALVYTVVFTDSMEIFPDMKGLSSSSLMFMRMFMCAGTMGAVGMIYNGTLWPIACTMCTLALVGMTLISNMYTTPSKEEVAA